MTDRHTHARKAPILHRGYALTKQDREVLEEGGVSVIYDSFQDLLSSLREDSVVAIASPLNEPQERHLIHAGVGVVTFYAGQSPCPACGK